MNTEFFERFKTTEELADYIATVPEFQHTSVSQFIKDNLPKESAFQTKIIKALKSWKSEAKRS